MFYFYFTNIGLGEKFKVDVKFSFLVHFKVCIAKQLIKLFDTFALSVYMMIRLIGHCRIDNSGASPHNEFHAKVKCPGSLNS